MRALVTGATGFVGSHLAEALHRRGDEITALVRSRGRAAALERLGVRVVVGDLDDTASLARAAEGQDVVFHVAGLVAARDEGDFMRCNRAGTAGLVAAATRANVSRFVYVSSMAAGGPAEPGRPLTGAEPARPVTAYGRSKLAGEAVVSAADIPWVIVRPPTVYGPRDKEVLKVFRMARLGVAPVFGDGSQQLSAVHGADLAAALLAVGTATAAPGHIYYACHPEIVTSAGFVRAVGSAMGRHVTLVPIPPGLGRALLGATELSARLTGRVTILTRDKANEFFQAAWIGDPGPLTRDSGWQPAHDLASGLADTFQWYRSAGWL
ncbi:MAG TPA: NAD-dependent epimerase/dehydratase family protein [Gemmatimonadales bacterium]|nr:NAD-dependent epimerase/dehydratase family protein [Gemmatimonadales bacterium]